MRRTGVSLQILIFLSTFGLYAQLFVLPIYNILVQLYTADFK
jgi:hypothetical protein